MKKRKTLLWFLMAILCVSLSIASFSVSAFASIANWEENNVVFKDTTFGTNGYYNVISKKDYTLVPGAATETEMVLNNSTGTRRQVLHIIELDPSNPDVSVLPGYYNIDKLAEDPADLSAYKAAGVTDVAAYYETLGYNVVGAMNTDLDYTDNAPRLLVYNGKILSGYAGASAPKSVLYVWNNNGEISCEVTAYKKDDLEAGVANGTLLHAISVSFDMYVKNGELVKKTEERTSSAAARSMVGVKEDGTLVIVMNDGRGANNSVGFCDYELGESMLALGCKWAANCDGGGSSSFVTRRAGEEDLICRCVPCDGAERPTKSSVIIVSNVAPTGVLDTVNIVSDYDYYAPGVSYAFGASAIDTHGYAMEMPANVEWVLSDASFGVIENGDFVSNGTTGNVKVQVRVDGDIVGEKTITVANPQNLELSATSTILPYSTSTKIRTLTLPIVARTGESSVYFDENVFSITSSNPAAGTLNGFDFTATSDESVAGTVITLTYKPTGSDLTYNVDFGKGSIVLWDFEDGDITDWKGTEETDAWMRENSITGVTTVGDWSTPFKTLFSGGQISWSCTTSTFLSTTENGGQVHNGNNALGINFDMRNVEFNSWVYVLVWNTKGNTVLRDVANGEKATQLGMWLYLPKGFRTDKNSGSIAWQLTVMKGANKDSLSGSQVHFQYNGKNINALTEADVPENRWIFVTARLDNLGNYVRLVDPANDVYRSPSFIRGYVKPSEAQVLTYYMDDITLDYSSAVDDRNPPVISNATYCITDTNIDFSDTPINANVVSFNANVSDYAASNAEGLDYSSAAIYLDGIKLGGVEASGSTMGVKDVNVSDGTHKVKFEIADKLGNKTSLTKTLTVNAVDEGVITLSGHNDLNSLPEAGSVYYVDLNVSDISIIKSATTTLYMRTANAWELDHMIVADGFDAEYSINECEPNRITITVINIGKVNATGEQSIISIPVRVWSFDESTWVGGDSTAAPKKMTASQRYAAYGEPQLFIVANVESGKAVLANGSETTFSGAINVATKVDGNKTNDVWHIHDENLTVLNKDATCTENGYQNRSYCETCGSVVEWGTKVPATGHTYELVDGKFICSTCGEVYAAGTGLFEINGNYYYSISGVLVSGWQQIEDDWYYFDRESFVGVNGTMEYGVPTYQFINGKLLSGVWIYDGERILYYYGPAAYHTGWKSIDGKQYYFNNFYCLTGNQVFSDAPGASYKPYVFSDTGVLISLEVPDGMFLTATGLYYIMNNTPVGGAFEYEGNIYYASTNDFRIKTGNYYVCAKNGNGLINEDGYYDFGNDGRLQQAKKNGFYTENGILVCYIEDVKQSGAFEYEGNIYYASTNGGAIKTGNYYVCAKNGNGLINEDGYYDFGNDGRLNFYN